mgnify:CR=1 FL=1
MQGIAKLLGGLLQKNPKLPTGDIEIIVSSFAVLNQALTPPFTIEDQTDGGDDLRMKYRYLDLRRPIYRRTAAGGHFGRSEPEFTWERTDKAALLKAAVK